ncbi:coproporphyrinogen III oxidase [Anopheles sinensis]|uniref:Coproporphyrinogen III oxidase n=1 Tax=Anopheles sinensis TaxID=74873 RepID=A0A084VFW5_ANOSI|nr:coproporphyrinogen III oxidase [Anopheles sinensis]
MQEGKRMPSKGPSSLVSGEERASTTATAAMNGVTPQRVRTDPYSPQSRTTTLSGVTIGGGATAWDNGSDTAEMFQRTAMPVGKSGITAAQNIRPKPIARILSGADRRRRQMEIILTKRALIELELQLIQLDKEEEEEEDYTEGGQEEFPETLGCGTEALYGEEVHASKPVVQFTSTGCPPAGSGEKGPDSPRDDIAAFLEWRRAIEAKVRASAMAEPVNAPAMAHTLNNHATEKDHATGTAHSTHKEPSHGYTATTSTSYLGFTAQNMRTDLGNTQTHSEHTAHVTSHSSHTSCHGTGTYTLQQTCSNPEMIGESRVDWGEYMEREGGVMQQQLNGNNRKGPAALHSVQDLGGVKGEISGSIEERPSSDVNVEDLTEAVGPSLLKGCGWSEDGDDNDGDSRMRTQHPVSSQIVVMSLPHNDGVSSCTRVGDGTIDEVAMPEPLVRNYWIPDGGGYLDRVGGGLQRGENDNIGSGDGFHCEQDDRSGGGESSDGAHWRSRNRQSSSTVYRGGCVVVVGLRRRMKSDKPRAESNDDSHEIEAGCGDISGVSMPTQPMERPAAVAAAVAAAVEEAVEETVAAAKVFGDGVLGRWQSFRRPETKGF